MSNNSKFSRDKFMTSKEVAEYFRLTHLTVINLCKTGKLPAFKLFGRWRVSRERLEEWMSQGNGLGLAP